MGTSFQISFLISLTVTMLETRADEAQLPVRIEFNRDIRPILSDGCFHCHGPDKHPRESGLLLDFREEVLTPAKSGEIPIMPGHPEKSDLVRRVLTDNADERMPPPKANKVLTTTHK